MAAPQEARELIGIPTARDVQDPQYLQALEIERLNLKVSAGNWPTCEAEIFLRDHVRIALELAGAMKTARNPKVVFDTDSDSLSGTQIARIGQYRKPFLRIVKSDMVLSQAQQLVQKYKETIGTASTHSPDFLKQHPRREFDPRARYEHLIGALEEGLEAVPIIAREDPVLRLRLTYAAIMLNHRNPLRETIQQDLWIQHWPQARDLERDLKTEAGKLYHENQRIAEKSDIFTDFSGFGLMVRNERDRERLNGLTFHHVWEPDKTPRFHGLWERASIRDAINGRLERHGLVVVNGITVGYQQGAYVADKQVPLWVANILGRPILTSKGDAAPERWAEEEARLVSGYRKLRTKEKLAKGSTHPIVNMIATLYYYDWKIAGLNADHRVAGNIYAALTPHTATFADAQPPLL